MYLINTLPVKECVTEKEYEDHNQEILTVIERLRTLPNYDCAVLYQRQDLIAANEKTRVISIGLHEIDELIEMSDTKHGVDLVADNELEYLIIVTYGQSYSLEGQNHLVSAAYKILPYDNNRNFLNVVEFIRGGTVAKAKNQFEETAANESKLN